MVVVAAVVVAEGSDAVNDDVDNRHIPVPVLVCLAVTAQVETEIKG